MRTLFRTLRIATIAGAFTALMLLAFGARAYAQPCGPNLSIGNGTPCTITISIVTTPPGVIPPQTLPPSVGVIVPVPAGTSIDGVKSNAGTIFLWAPNIPPPPPLVASNITMPPSKCCCDIFYDPATCSISILPSTAPPPCNP